MQFMGETKNSVPQELTKLVLTYMYENELEEDTFEMVVASDFLDADGLKEKFKTKPNRLAAIPTNTKKAWCISSECELIADMAYKSNEPTARNKRKEKPNDCHHWHEGEG